MIPPPWERQLWPSTAPRPTRRRPRKPPLPLGWYFLASWARWGLPIGLLHVAGVMFG